MNTMEFKYYVPGIIALVIMILLILNFVFDICEVKFKHFFKKSLREKVFIITFASEIERDRILTLIERDKRETEELEKQAKDFGLK